MLVKFEIENAEFGGKKEETFDSPADGLPTGIEDLISASAVPNREEKKKKEKNRGRKWRRKTEGEEGRRKKDCVV